LGFSFIALCEPPAKKTPKYDLDEVLTLEKTGDESLDKQLQEWLSFSLGVAQKVIDSVSELLLDEHDAALAKKSFRENVQKPIQIKAMKK